MNQNILISIIELQNQTYNNFFWKEITTNEHAQ